MTFVFRNFVVLIAWLGLVPFASAQEFPDKLLSLLPDDFAVCVMMHDLRGQAAHWEKSDWVKSFRQSPLGRTFLDAPELKQFDVWQQDLKKHFDLDWPGLRDDILGKTVLLAYQPGPANKPDDERGLVLLQVHKTERLALFVNKLNELQKKSGELKSLTAIEHKGKTYYRRVQGPKTQFYLMDGSLAAVSSQEEMIRGVLDRQAQPAKTSPWAKRFQRAGADQAFVTMCINPRMLELDFVKNKKGDDGLPGYWQALDGIFVTFSMRNDAAIRVAIQANVDQLPKWTRAAFTDTAIPSDLWKRFPEQSILTIASRTDFAGMVDALKMLLPEKDRKNLNGLGAVIGLDLFKDVLPNVGPDWGVCVLPAKDPQHLPQMLIAVAVKPGANDPPIDQMLFKAVQVFATVAVLDHNQKNPEPIRIMTAMQDKIEIKYLSHDKLFPPGLQPAAALKDGYLLLASSPDAILAFRKHEFKIDTRLETPMVRLSTRELAKVLRQREHSILTSLKQRQGMSAKEAKQNLDSVTSLLDLFDRVILSQHAEAGQATWTLRFTPASRSP